MSNDQMKKQTNNTSAGKYTATGFQAAKIVKPSTVAQRCFHCGGMKHGIFEKCPARNKENAT